MVDGAGFPSPVRRAFQSLADGSGRTLVIAGPATSGKSELLREIREDLRARGVVVFDLAGAYRDREAPFAAVAPLERPEPPPGADGETAEAPGEDAPMAALAYGAEPAPAGRRARGGRQRATILGVAYSVRGRGIHDMDPAEFWQSLAERSREEPARRVAVLLEDGCLADAESRQYLMFLSERARLRPLLLVLVLDSSEPAFGAWEERLVGRGDVDWVRIPHPKSDPREVSRIKRGFDGLTDRVQEILVFAALMGGSVSEVSLSRVTRLSFGELAERLAPAIEAHLVKVEAGKVTIPHADWIAAFPGFLDPPRVRELHREIAEALEALSPEPNLGRQMEMADHFLAWEAGPTALRYLLEAAEFSERLSAYDNLVDLLGKARTCVPALPRADRPLAEAELDLFLARALFYAGLPAEAEAAMTEGLNLALGHDVPPEQLEDWLEPLVPALLATGPRPSLLTELGEVVDRLHEGGAAVPEVLFQAVDAVLEYERGRVDRARRAAYRAGQAARRIERGPVQALAMSVIGLTHSSGTDAEARLSARFLRSSSEMFAGARRFGLQQVAEDFRARLLEARGHPAEALAIHERSIQVLRRLHLPALELSHQLGVAALRLEGRREARSGEAIKRAREIVEMLHLLPPSPDLLRTWYLEGRGFETAQVPEAARERYAALADRPEVPAVAALRRDAIGRLVRIELAAGRDAEARRYFGLLTARDLGIATKPRWSEWAAALRKEIADAAPRGRRRALAQERGEEARVEGVDDRHDPDDRQDHHDEPLEAPRVEPGREPGPEEAG